MGQVVLHGSLSSASSVASSRRRKSVITSNRIMTTSTNSGSVLSSRSASDATTARSGLRRRAVSVPIAGGVRQATLGPKESADDIAIELFYKSRGQPDTGNRLVY